MEFVNLDVNRTVYFHKEALKIPHIMLSHSSNVLSDKELGTEHVGYAVVVRVRVSVWAVTYMSLRNMLALMISTSTN